MECGVQSVTTRMSGIRKMQQWCAVNWICLHQASNNLPNYTTKLHFSSGASVLPFSVFGSFSNLPVLLDSVHCFGTEESLLDCPHGSIGNHFCSQFSFGTARNVAIKCQGNLPNLNRHLTL